ncbi:MAG: dodecin family protein [Proteobacteria bacterium]|nr:dodecin family protein [Pseudomonadota bacterium]MBU1716151.1 dodecin family protein [Pseudomonadota bacterium]
MGDQSVYKIVEFVGTSKLSWEDAAKNAVNMAKKDHSDLRVATVKELDMTMEGEMVSTYRARVLISFKFHL